MNRSRMHVQAGHMALAACRRYRPCFAARRLGDRVTHRALTGLFLSLLLSTLLCALAPEVHAQSAPQAVSIGVGGDNLTRLLWNNSDGSVSLWRLNSDSSVTSYTYGPSPGWSAQSLAVGADNVSHILWDRSDGYETVWDVNNQGVQTNAATAVAYIYTGYTARTVAVGPNNAVRVLWANPNGSASLWDLSRADPAGARFDYTTSSSWAATNLAVGGDNAPNILWRNMDGSVSLWKIDSQGGETAGGTNPTSTWTAVALAVDGGSAPHLVWDHPSDNTIQLWNVAANHSPDLMGSLTSYQGYSDPAGFRPKALASGSDGKLRLLWTKPDGTVQVWTIDASGNYTPATYSPYVNGLRIDAGSSNPYADNQGARWAADYGSSGGSPAATGAAITGTSDPALYQTQRVGGSFSYALSVPNGKYVLGLSFAETGGSTTGQRVFNVSANGTALMTGFDVYAAAGGANKAITQSFLVNVTNGQLALAFTGTTGQAALAALSLTIPTPAPDIPPPGWAEDVMPTDDASDAEGLGPAAASSVNLASGVEENSPGPDLWAYNPVGPSASYERRYRSARAQKGYASPGLSAGWTDGYDLFVTPTSGGYTLTYDNGGQEQWTGTTGGLGTPAGAPYLVNASGGALTMTFKDRSKYIFTQVPTAGGNYPAGAFLLTGITNLVGHAITLNRDTAANGYRLLSITNDASPVTVLLTFAYQNGSLYTVTDAYNRQITYGFSGGLLSGVSQIAAPNTSPAWRWQYGYQAVAGASLLASVLAPDPSNPGSMAVAVTTYDANGAVSQHRDASQRVHSYGYGGSQTVVQVNNADGSLAQTWTQKQNAGGAGKNADTGSVDAAGKAGSVSYAGTPSPYLPSAATNRNGQTAQVTYDTSNPYGNVASVLSPRGVKVTTAYQYPADFPLGQALSVTQSHLNAGGTVDDTKQGTSFTYYGPTDVPDGGGAAGAINGLLKSVTSPLPDTVNGTQSVTTTYKYDALGDVTQTSGPNANGTMMVAYNYTTDGAFTQAEALGEPLTVTVTGLDAVGGMTSTVTHYRYDNRGNRTAVIDALGHETDLAYNLADQLTDTLPPATGDSGTGRAKTTTTYQYPGGPAGGTTVYDESGASFRQTSNVYDADGELLTVNGNTYPVSYVYDGRGRVKSVTYYGQTMTDAHATFYDYDAVGNLAAVRYPNQSGATFDQTHYTYDADGNAATEINGVGVTKTYARVDPESLLTGISYGYPAGYSGTRINPVSFGYDHWGRRASLGNDATTVAYAYDDLDELLGTTTAFGNDLNGYPGPTGQQVAYGHNPDGSRRSLSLPGTNYGNTQAYEYDGVGRLSATYLPGGPVYGARYTYLANGWLSRRRATYDPYNWNNDAPYLQTDLAYNPRGLMTALTNSQVSGANVLTPLSSFSGMSYDADGNRLGETAAVPARGSAPSLSRTVTYAYDALDQLTGETSSGSAAGLTYTHAWAYDLSGNPTTNRTGSAAYNADNQNTATSYNGTGDPLSLPVFATTEAAQFDPEDRLTQTGPADFAARYDGDGLRAWSILTGGSPTYYLYDGDQPVAEVDYTGMQVAFTLAGASGTELRYQNFDTQPNSPGTAYTFDPQGSAVQPVTLYLPGQPPFLKVRSSSAYDAFGLLRAAATADAADTFDPVGFGGQQGYYHDYSGLYLLTHRYYDAGAGRFVTRDPIGYKGGINLYGFAGNNPVNESDPEGTDWLDNLADGSYAMGGIVSGGLTNRIDHALGVDSGINRNSTAYHVGTAAGYTYVAASAVVGGVGIINGVRTVRAAGGVRAVVSAAWTARKAQATVTNLAEVKTGNLTKAANAVKHWDEFLGDGPTTNIHPRTGAVSDSRIVAKVGMNKWRSVRFGSHEVRNPKNLHYNLEEWKYNPIKNHFTVSNHSFPYR